MEVETSDLDYISVIEELDKPCGEVFMSIEGNMIFLCTLCGDQYNDAQMPKRQAIYEYNRHMMKKHSQIDEDILIEEDESIMSFKLDVSSPRAEDGFRSIDKMEFNCREIEEYSVLLKNKTKICKFSENRSGDIQMEVIDTKTTREKVPKIAKTSFNVKPPISKARRYKCPKCGFVTKSYSTAMMHIARHMNDKRHFCQQCKKGFYTPNELRVHTRIHTNERPYLCNDCGNTFVTNSGLWRHIKSCRNIRDKQCPKCQLKFHDNAGLRNHLASVHSQERSFKCSECNACFKLNKALRNHIKIHENKHEFKCNFCPASFNQQPGLSSHMKNKHSTGKLFKDK